MPIVLVTDANPGTAEWQDLNAAQAAEGYSSPTSLFVTGTLAVRDTANLTMPTLDDGETAIYEVDVTWSRMTNPADTFTYNLRVGPSAGENRLKLGSVTENEAGDDSRWHAYVRLIFRRQGGTIRADAFTLSTLATETVDQVGEAGPDDPISDTPPANGGPLVIELEAGFTTASGLNGITLQQFCVTRIR